MRRRKQRGATLVEMTLVGIPIIFALIATFEVSRGMWIYGTLSYAAREATRYVVVHGVNCQTLPNTCGITPAQLGTYVNQAAAGLIDSQLTVEFHSDSDDFSCKLSDLMTNTANCTGTVPNPVPSTGGNVVTHFVVVTLSYPFYSGFLGSVSLPAYSRESIQF